MNDEKPLLTIFWFRRDLRLEDNHGLYKALQGSEPVLPLFIFDSLILSELSDRKDRRVAYIHQLVSDLSKALKKRGSSLYVGFGPPATIFEQLLEKFRLARVVTNHDFEPYAIERDNLIRALLSSRGIPFVCCKDQVIFDPAEIVKPDGTPYVVYTPYSRAWKRRLGNSPPAVYPSLAHLHRLWQHPPLPVPCLRDLGFQQVEHGVPAIRIEPQLLRDYAATRDMVYLEGTSKASPHLRFGTVSVRQLVGLAMHMNETYLNELIWREFFMMILYHFPYVVRSSFRRQYDAIRWRNHEDEFQAWCAGRTGYPLVDAGMRQLNATGRMHNRVRMVTAGFLTKHLLIDWRWGEAYFAEKLLDYEQSSNNGNWQWAAGCGCDAAPYFRIFNPAEQARKFDPESRYIRSWIPDFPADYPAPLVDHAYARQRALQVYKQAVG